MLTFKKDEPIYKVLVKLGFIASNAEAKRLVEYGAVSFNYENNYTAIGHRVGVTDPAALLTIAASNEFYLRIGKKVLEPLSLVEEK